MSTHKVKYTGAELDAVLEKAEGAITAVNSAITSFWKGTQAEYDAIVEKDPKTFYIIEE